MWSGNFLAVVEARFIDAAGGCGDVGKSVVDGVEGGGDGREIGARQIGEGDLRALQGETRLLEGFVGRAVAFGPRVEGVHCAWGFSSCWQVHFGEHFSLQPQSLHWAWAGMVERARSPRRVMRSFME